MISQAGAPVVPTERCNIIYAVATHLVFLPEQKSLL